MLYHGRGQAVAPVLLVLLSDTFAQTISIDKKLVALVEKSGVLYDSEVVDACLRLLRKGGIQFDMLMAAADCNYAAVATG